MFRKAKRIHFVGIGGIGMSGIAEVLLNQGYSVSGSDLADTEMGRRLSRMGATVYVGHRAENVGGAEVVVISSAIAADNPEVFYAYSRKIPVIPRAEMLAEFMRLKFGIAIAGTHGKTTTTSMIATVLGEAGIDPTILIGGRLDSIGSNARLGFGEYMVAEADESDGSFLLLPPTIAVVTNIDPEHMEHYGTLDRLQDAFSTFVNKVPFYGLAVLCIDCENVRVIEPRMRKRFVTYGIQRPADFSAERIEFSGRKTAFDVLYGKEKKRTLGRIEIAMPGLHTVYNALAATAVAAELDIGFEKVREALAGFTGIRRRFELKGEVGGVMVIDDYGHHPTEIKATLEAAKGGWNRRVVVAFQPHRYTRSRDLKDEFAAAFDNADVLIVTDIYPAGEKPIPGVTGQMIFDGILGHGHPDARFVPCRDDVPQALLDLIRPGDIVITLGAGDLNKAGEALVEMLRKKDEGGK